jgi:hypothetical protein
MVGTITIPIMMSMGIRPLTAGLIHCAGQTAAWPFWIIYWPNKQIWINVWPGDFAWFAMLTTVVVLVMIFAIDIPYFFRREGVPLRSLNPLPLQMSGEGEDRRTTYDYTDSMGVEAREEEKEFKPVSGIACIITTAAPLILIFFANMHMNLAFFIGMLLAIILTHPGSERSLTDVWNISERIFYAGVGDSVPLILIFMVAGMTRQVFNFPAVAASINTSMGALVPSSIIMFILVGFVLSFIGIYRGAFIYNVAISIFVTFAVSGLAGIFAKQHFLYMWWALELAYVCIDPTFGTTNWTSAFIKDSPINLWKKGWVFWLMKSWVMLVIAGLAAVFGFG